MLNKSFTYGKYVKTKICPAGDLEFKIETDTNISPDGFYGKNRCMKAGDLNILNINIIIPHFPSSLCASGVLLLDRDL